MADPSIVPRLVADMLETSFVIYIDILQVSPVPEASALESEVGLAHQVVALPPPLQRVQQEGSSSATLLPQQRMPNLNRQKLLLLQVQEGLALVSQAKRRMIPRRTQQNQHLVDLNLDRRSQLVLTSRKGRTIKPLEALNLVVLQRHRHRKTIV